MPQDVANIILFLASDESSAITGQSIITDFGSTLLLSFYLKIMSATGVLLMLPQIFTYANSCYVLDIQNIWRL